MATLRNLRHHHLPLPGGAVSISPWTDLTCSGASFISGAATDLLVTRHQLVELAAGYLDGADPRLPLASPIFGDLGGLPLLLLLVGSDETLLDDAIGLSRAVALGGGEVTLSIGGGMQHDYPLYVGAMPESEAAVNMIGAWIRARACGRSTSPGME